MEKSDYGSKEELIRVCKILRISIRDLMTGDKSPQSFFHLYLEFEGFLLEHGYAEEFGFENWDEIKSKIDENFLKQKLWNSKELKQIGRETGT